MKGLVPFNDYGTLIPEQEQAILEKFNALTVVGVKTEQDRCAFDGPEILLAVKRRELDEQPYTPLGNEYVCQLGINYASESQIDNLLTSLSTIPVAPLMP